ncbi:MAG TPA: xanthine dehydrogenase family protein molybdopterin-binding subunit [Candidatus Limnocylindrales bacterium]|nr:xanthine dehydrogenase family protein molybdopterin-binding subunit [Candidatus Limnocylindrales bacterium]
MVDTIVARRPVPGRAQLPPRREGPAKLTGAATFTDDLVVPGAWYGLTIRSTEPRARLVSVGFDHQFDAHDVVLVTADDIPGENVVSLISDDQPVLVPIGGEIRHFAEPLALVAAPDRSAVRAARAHVIVATEPLDPVFDPLESREEFSRYELERGDVDEAMAAADLIVDEIYRVGHQEQLYIENQAMIAIPREDGGVTVHGSLQCPYYIHRAMKRALRLDDDQAVVIQEETGGGFGGKEEYPSMIALHAALLARKCGKPVRMIYGRNEDISATTKRHPAIIHYRTGVAGDGRLLAHDIEIVVDGGAYRTLTPVVLSRAVLQAGGPYHCRNIRVRGRAMATNTPPNGAFRGFGAPQIGFADETQVNRVAATLDISPLVLRRQWIYRQGDTTPTGGRLDDSLGLSDVLEAATGTTQFEANRARAASQGRVGPVTSGIGLALGWHGAGLGGSGEVRTAAVASVELTADGRIRILTGSTEMGQGTKTILPQLVAEELGVPYTDVEIAPQDTSVVPDSGPTVSSRTAMVVGGLLVGAARHLRREVEERTGAPFAEAYKKAGPLRIDERFRPYPNVTFDDEQLRGDAYPAYGWGAAVARVEVDRDTGEVHVIECTAADDLGRVIHPVLAEGQVEGGTLQAIGYATIEEIKLQGGRYLNDRLATYLIPTSLDAPKITSILVEKPFTGAPHGAKGVGELPINVAAPAVVAAIHDAIGVWINELPATPERVLQALGSFPEHAS